MNKKYLADFARKHLEPMQRIEWNRPPKLNHSWSTPTVDTTLSICGWAAKNKLYFACETKMKNGRRADIIIPELFEAQIIEIYDSETTQSLESKQYDYTATGAVMRAIPADPEQALLLLDSLHNA